MSWTSASPDRVAIVTGGNRGIGYAVSAELLAEGAHVVVASLDPARNAQALRDAQEQSNGRVIGVPTDLNDPAAVEALFKTTLAEFGRLDILVNNAANVCAGQLLRRWTRKPGTTPSITSCTAPCAASATPCRRCASANGAASSTCPAARPGRPSSAPSPTGINNAAVQNLTVALANELGKDGILVNAVVPTAIRTDRHDKNIKDAMAKTGQSEAEVLKPRVAKIPLGRMGTAEEVAGVVAFLASERASFVTGSAWAVDGGVSARL